MTTTSKATLDRISSDLLSIGACWVARAQKHVLPSEGWGAPERYHIHPDASYPHERDMLHFSSIADLERWIAEERALQAAEENER